MTLNTSRREIISERREQVARLVVKGLTQREIAAQVGYNVATVNGDLKALRKIWRANAEAEIAEHLARQLAELQAAKRKAWANDDLAALARFFKLEQDLLGTAQPTKVQLDWREQARREGINPDDVINELVKQFTSAMVGESSSRGVADSDTAKEQ